MALVNFITNEIQFDVVIFGPPGVGKKSFIRYIFGQLAPDADAVLSDECLPDHESSTSLSYLGFRHFSMKGFVFRDNLFACSINSLDVAANMNSLLIARADAIIFLANSDPALGAENEMYYSYMLDQIKANGAKPTSGKIVTDRPVVREGQATILKIRALEIPLWVSFNKRDLPTADSLQNLRQTVDENYCRVHETVVSQGLGIFGLLKHSRNQSIYGILGEKGWFEDLT